MLCFWVCNRGAQTGLSHPWPPCAPSDGRPEQGGKGLCTYDSCVGVGNTECNAGFHPCKLSGSFPDRTSTQTSEVRMWRGSVFCKERSGVTRHHRIWQLRGLNLDFLSCPALSLTPACMHTCRVMIIINTCIIYITSYMITAY